MSQKECKACERVLLDNPPFCAHCWEKNFTDDEIEKSDQVWVVRTKQDFYACAGKAKEAPQHTYVLIEGELTQQISEAFKVRARLATERNNKKLKFAGAVAIAASTVALQVLTKQSGSKINPSELLKQTAPSVVGTVVKGAGLTGSSDDEELFKTLAFAPECDLMFNTNFRLIGNANGYVVLRREKAVADGVNTELKGTANDLKGVAEDVSRELKGTVNDIKGVAGDVGSAVKKGWNWLKSSKASP
jgi:hypothetical protein